MTPRTRRALPWIIVIGVTVALSANLTWMVADTLLAERPVDPQWLSEMPPIDLTESR